MYIELGEEGGEKRRIPGSKVHRTRWTRTTRRTRSTFSFLGTFQRSGLSKFWQEAADKEHVPFPFVGHPSWPRYRPEAAQRSHATRTVSRVSDVSNACRDAAESIVSGVAKRDRKPGQSPF